MEIVQLDINRLYGLNAEKECPLTGYIHSNSPELNPDKKRRALIVLPGGGYAMTSDREAEPVAFEFFNRDFNVFVLRYAVKPAVFPLQLLQAACAVDYIRGNADSLGVISDKIFIMGFSAGGHLAGNLSNDYHKVSGLYGKPLFSRPDATVLCYPCVSAKTGYTDTHRNLTGRESGYDFEEKFGSLNLDDTVTENNPPAFIWHTFSDNAVPVSNSLLYSKALSDKQIKFELHIFPDGGHGLSLADERTANAQSNYINPKCAQWTQLAAEFLKNL